MKKTYIAPVSTVVTIETVCPLLSGSQGPWADGKDNGWVEDAEGWDSYGEEALWTVDEQELMDNSF